MVNLQIYIFRVDRTKGKTSDWSICRRHRDSEVVMEECSSAESSKFSRISKFVLKANYANYCRTVT